MKRHFATLTLVATLIAMPLAARQAAGQQGQGQAQAQKGPHPKSQKELEALQKVLAAQQASNWDGEIQAINNVLENFADTDYKNMLLNMATDAAQNKGDYAQTVVYGERAIQADPNNITARVTLADAIAQHTRDNDLDKDQSIKKVNDYATQALDLLKNASAPPAGIPEANWPETKKVLTAQSYYALGQAAALQKKFPDAITNFKTALDSQPNFGAAMAQLSKAYVDNKQYDDAISTADKVLAMNDQPAVVKQFAQQQKDAATKLKGTK